MAECLTLKLFFFFFNFEIRYKYLNHLNEVDKENIFVLVTEAINVIVDHPSVMVNCKPDGDQDHDGDGDDDGDDDESFNAKVYHLRIRMNSRSYFGLIVEIQKNLTLIPTSSSPSLSSS